MIPFQIEALRDLAIEHLPSAQKERKQAQQYAQRQSTYYESLAVIAMLTLGKSTNTAIEAKAANLLRLVMAILLTDYECNPSTSDWAIEEAKELCILTGQAIPWLDSLPTPTAPAIPVAAELPVSVTVTKQPTLEPGQYLTTAEAAKALSREAQTLRSWVSKQTGPINPRGKVGRQHRWLSDDIIALLNCKK